MRDYTGTSIHRKRYGTRRQAMPEPSVSTAANAQPFTMRRGPVGALLIHGFAASPFDLRPLGEWLAKRNISVYGMRVAGHGTSPRDLERTTPAQWRSSVDDAYKNLRRYARTVFIIGDSFGGNLAIDCAARLPLGAIAGIVTMGTPIFLPRERWKKIVLPLVAPIKRTYRKPWIGPDTAQRNVQKGSYNDVPLRSFLQFLSFLGETKRQLPLLRTPLLIFCSRHDRVVRPESAEYLYHRAGSADKQLFWIAEPFHHVLESDHGERVSTLILHFLLTHAAPPQSVSTPISLRYGRV